MLLRASPHQRFSILINLSETEALVVPAQWTINQQSHLNRREKSWSNSKTKNMVSSMSGALVYVAVRIRIIGLFSTPWGLAAKRGCTSTIASILGMMLFGRIVSAEGGRPAEAVVWPAWHLTFGMGGTLMALPLPMSCSQLPMRPLCWKQFGSGILNSAAIHKSTAWQRLGDLSFSK